MTGSQPTLSLSAAKTAVQSILTEFDRDTVKSELELAVSESAGNLNEIMVRVVPLIFEIQGHIMEPLGFTGDDDGFAAFASELQRHESDSEFLLLSQQLKQKMKSLTAVNNNNTVSAAEADDDEDESAEGSDDRAEDSESAEEEE